MGNQRAECWSAGVLESCSTPALRDPGAPRFVRSPRLRLAGRLLIGAGLLAVTMTGCGPSSDKVGKQSGTNGAAPQALAKTTPAPAARPGVITNLASANSLAAAKTNAAARAAAKAKAAQAAGRPAGTTNAAPTVARTGASKNAASAAGAKSGFAEKVRSLQANPAFYPAAGVIFVCLCLAVVLVARLLKAKAAKADKGAPPGTMARAAAKPARKKARAVTIHSCNVLQVGAQARQLWQFDARGRGFVLNREQTGFAGSPCRPGSSPRIGARCGSTSSMSPGCHRSMFSCAWHSCR